MAAIYSGIHLKLRSPQTQWEDKVKLARFAWISSQCLLPNKEQVLLDWCCHALTGWYNQKVEFSQNVLEGLWCYLDDLLHSRKLSSLLKQGKTVSLRLNMAQLLLERLQECSRVGTQSLLHAPTILSVCHGVLSSPVLSSVFITKYELMVDLLAKLCAIACSELQQPQPAQTTCTGSDPCEDEVTEPLETPAVNGDPAELLIETETYRPQDKPSSNVFELLFQVSSCYLTVQRQQANPNRVFTMVTNQLIQPLVLLRHLLTSGDTNPLFTHVRLRQQLCRDIRVRIDSILQSALFPSEHLSSYKEELLPSKAESGKRGPGGAKGPLKPVAAVLPKLMAQDFSVKSNTVSLLFRFFMDSFGKGRGDGEEEQKMLCFYFLMRLVPLLDLCPNGDLPAEAQQSSSEMCPPSSPHPPESWSLALLSLESLLSQTLSADVYNVAADKIRHQQVQLLFYRALAQMLFNQAQPSVPAWYRCLKLLLSLNHLILEPDLDQLLSSAWVNSESMEPRVQRARQLLVCSLLQTYTKLRQLPHFFSELLSVICQPALDELRPPLLPEGISSSLRTCLLDTPSSQCLQVCSSVLDSIRKSIIPGLLRDEEEAEQMEVNGEEDLIKVDQRRLDLSLKLFSLSHLLHAVLFSVKTLDNSSPVPLVRQGQALMEDMQQLVRVLLQILPRGHGFMSPQRANKSKKKRKCTDPEKVSALWEQKAQEAMLLLRYTWVEVDTLFKIHCFKYTSPEEEEDPETHLENLLCGGVSSSCSPMSSLLLKQLTLQQMRRIMVTHSLSAPTIRPLLNKAAAFITADLRLGETPGGQQVWDGQIISVDSSSYLVAHWHLVATHLSLIYRLLSEEDLSAITHNLIASLLTGQLDRQADLMSSGLTIPLISAQLLESSIFPELPSLFSATVRSLTQQIFSVLMEARSPRICATFEKAETGRDVSRDPPTLPAKETIVKDILASSKSGHIFVSLTGTQIKELENLLNIFTMINPDGMNSDDLSSVFLLLFFMLSSASCPSSESTDGGQDGALQVKLLRVLTSLVESSNLKGVLKLVHAGSLLQALVSSLHWHCSNGRYRSTPSTHWSNLIQEVQDFISSLVQLIIERDRSLQLNLNQFVSFLTGKETPSDDALASSADVWIKAVPGSNIRSVHLDLASLTSFAQAMTSNLGRSKLMDQTLTQMLARVIGTLGPAVESVSGSWSASEAGVLDQVFVVEVVSAMLNSELSSLSVQEQDKQEDAIKFSQIHMHLYRNLCQKILQDLSSDHRPILPLVSSLNFLSLYYETAERTGKEDVEDLFNQLLQCVHKLLTAPWLSSEDVSELEPAVQELLRHLLENSSNSQLQRLLLMIREGLNVGKLRAGNSREVLSAVTLTKLLFTCHLPEDCTKAVWHIAPQLISAMVFLVRSCGPDSSLTLPVTVPTVTSLTSLLRQGEGLITNPHHVVLVLGALQSVTLDHLAPPVYMSAFLCVHEALFTMIQCHCQVLLTSAPSYLNVFYRLVASIMQEGVQRGDRDTGSDDDVYLQCSRLVERMYSHIAAAPESFTTLSAFIVAQYVTELQKVTLRPDVKLHLTEGIYQILDLCAEQDMKFLLSGLTPGVREVFNDLYSSFTHSYRARRQGEEKYTV